MIQVDHENLLDAYADHIEGTDLAESTVVRYRTNVRQYLEWVAEILEENSALDGVFDVTPETLESHLRQMNQEGYAPQSVNLRRAAIKSFYESRQDLVHDQTVTVLAGLDVFAACRFA